LKLHGCLWSPIHIYLIENHTNKSKAHYSLATLLRLFRAHTHTQTTNQKIMNRVMDVSTIIISRKRKLKLRRDKGRSICSVSVQQVTGCTKFHSSLVVLIKSYTVDMITVHSTTINTHTHTVYHYLHIS